MYRKSLKTAIVFTILVATTSFTAMAQQVANTDTLMKHVRNLASSQYEGRLAGTDGFDRASEYVSEALSRYGIRPYHQGGHQYFQIECNVIENCTFNSYINAEDTRTVYVLGKDFACAGMTGRGYADAQVVFCGYGIDNAVYNEYANVDAKGKIVIVLTGVPNYVPSNITKKYATLRDKARIAQKHGALALVAINLSNTCRHDEVQGKVYSGEGPHLATFPILQATKKTGNRLLADEKMTLNDAMAKMQETASPQSFLLTKRFEIDVNATYNPEAITHNIVGIYEPAGSKLSKEYIVVGAHLDHVGLQGKTCLFPGADDNASGVAALLEVARMLQQSPEQPKRSIIFVVFSGAEQSHLGSQIFVSNFKPLRSIEAFINAECIGSGDSIAVMGNKRFPLIWNIASEMDSAHTQKMVRGFKTLPKGDATAFHHVGIPSLVFSTFNGNKHAHVPSDIPENVDRHILTETTTLMYHTVMELAKGYYQGRSEDSKRIRF